MSEGTITNNAAQTQSFLVLSLANQFDLVSNEPLVGTLQPFGANQTIGSQPYTLASGASALFGPFTISGMDNESFTSAGDIASLIGPGTIEFDPFTLIFTTFAGGGGNIAADIETFANATVSIKYFGEVIPPGPGTPEPSALLGLGLITGLGFMSKKRASK